MGYNLDGELGIGDTGYNPNLPVNSSPPMSHRLRPETGQPVYHHGWQPVGHGL